MPVAPVTATVHRSVGSGAAPADCHDADAVAVAAVPFPAVTGPGLSHALDNDGTGGDALSTAPLGYGAFVALAACRILPAA